MTPRLPCLSSLLATLAILGCSDPGGPADVRGGQTGEETVGCLPVRSEALASAALSPLGFSADELLANLGSERRVPLTWDDGTSTSLQLELSYTGGDVVFSEREYRDDASGAELVGTEEARPEPALVCNDVLSIAATLTFVTADGAFNESWPVVLGAETASTARVFQRLESSAVRGSFRVTEVDPATFDEVSLIVTVDLGSGAWTGSVEGQATLSGGPGSEDSVSARNFPIASF